MLAPWAISHHTPRFAWHAASPTLCMEDAVSFLKQVEQLAHEHGVLLRQRGTAALDQAEHRRQADVAQLHALIVRLRARDVDGTTACCGSARPCPPCPQTLPATAPPQGPGGHATALADTACWRWTWSSARPAASATAAIGARTSAAAQTWLPAGHASRGAAAARAARQLRNWQPVQPIKPAKPI